MYGLLSVDELKSEVAELKSINSDMAEEIDDNDQTINDMEDELKIRGEE